MFERWDFFREKVFHLLVQWQQMARAQLVWSWKPGASFWSPTWVQGLKDVTWVTHCCHKWGTASGSKAARTQTGIHLCPFNTVHVCMHTHVLKVDVYVHMNCGQVFWRRTWRGDFMIGNIFHVACNILIIWTLCCQLRCSFLLLGPVSLVSSQMLRFAQSFLAY